MANGHSAEGIEATRGPDYNDGFDFYVSPETNMKVMSELKREIDQKRDMQDIDAQKMREIRMQILGEKDDTRKMSIAFKRPFDPKDVKERPGKGGRKFYYIDARHVMRRLDEVLGLEFWQTRYHETLSGRVICELSVCINGNWIVKSDGAGATDIEGEKGAISDALKRSAVLLGIGAYLYNAADFKNGVPAPWATPDGYDKLIAKQHAIKDSDEKWLDEYDKASKP